MTHIVFQHNQEGENMDVTLQIYNAAGALARTITQNIITTGNRTEILWDGLGQNGTPLFRGVYFYRLTARTSKGISATAYQKLVLLR
jgi:flagellar hook assembly protein FlgD